MNSIHVSSLPLSEVIKEIAENMGTSFSEDCGEYFLQLPAEIGNGSIRGINFEGGLGIIQYNCTFIKDTEIHFVVNEVHPLKFMYTIEGTLLHRFQHEDSIHTINQYQNAIIASSYHNGHVLVFKANQSIKINSLEINRREFKIKMECHINNLENELKTLFKDTSSEIDFYHNGNYSLVISNLLTEMSELNATGFIRRTFLEGMAYLILSQQMLQYYDDKKDVAGQRLLRSSELRQIHLLANNIESKISEVSTIENMAKEAGLNVNKLQEGFKMLYGSTVNNFVQKKRLDAAYNLLTNTDLTISEIVIAIGLSSKSYFSKIFKEKYDLSPSDFRKKRKKS
jgi:AraC-like DNA-binding protein